MTRYRRALVVILNWLVSWLGFLTRIPNYVRRSWPGDDPLRSSKDEAVYVHFDPNGQVHDYVVEQLRALAAAEFRVTFVSNAPHLREDNLARIVPFCRQIIWRRNFGYDFGAYKDGIRAIGNLEKLDRLLLMNDSVYGPLRHLKEILAKVDPATTDVWGITESWEFQYHVQSYFVLFFTNALRLPEFATFWRRLPYINWKGWVIRNGEIKLTQVMAQRKMRISVMIPYWEVAQHVLKKLEQRSQNLTPAHQHFLESIHDLIVRGVPMNPSHYFWEILVTDFGCPFIKREVILTNPAGVPQTWRWSEVVANKSSYDPNLVWRHLQAIAKRV